MTIEELIAAGLPVDRVVEGAENAAPTEDAGSPSGSRSREDGEVQSDDDEDIEDVDAGVGDLVKVKTAGPLPPSLAFGESKVTTNMIREYEKAGFFPPGAGRAPLDEQIPTPETEKLSSFVTSSSVDSDSLRPDSAGYSGCLFGEDPPTFPDVFS
jgi:hypothetical protein